MKHQLGTSLVEVMVSTLVLAIGLLGVLAMQARSVQLNQNAYLYSQAAVLANDIMEAMRTSGDASATNYQIAFEDDTPVQPNCTTVGIDCSPEEISAWNLSEWRTNIESLLPYGAGEVMRISGGGNVSEYEIKVRFQVGFDESRSDPVVTDEVILRTSI